MYNKKSKTILRYQELVYPRIKHPILEVKQKDLLFSLVHNIYRNRSRLFQQSRTSDPLCPNQACKNEGLVQDIEHIFCSCYKVRTAWHWTRAKILEFVTELGPPITVTNIDILLAMYPTCRREEECLFLLGNYVELVDREVIYQQKELVLNTLRGFLQAKMKYMIGRAVPQIQMVV